MIQITPQMRLLLAMEPADFRKGIDGLVGLCRQRLEAEPLEGALFVFRNRSAKSLKIICYDGYENTEIMGRPRREPWCFPRNSESSKGWCSHNFVDSGFFLCGLANSKSDFFIVGAVGRQDLFLLETYMTSRHQEVW